MDYQELLKSCQARLGALQKQRVEIDREMVGLARTIEGLRVLAQVTPQISSPPPPPPGVLDEASGFTDKVRAVLQSNETRSFSPTEIRDALVASGQEDSKIVLIQ